MATARRASMKRMREMDLTILHSPPPIRDLQHSNDMDTLIFVPVLSLIQIFRSNVRNKSSFDC